MTSLTTFTADGLQSISGIFELLNLTALVLVSAPNLTSVGGIDFAILPLLETLTLDINQASSLRISDTELTAFGVSITSVGDFSIGFFHNEAKNI
jgi:hypothetical protein